MASVTWQPLTSAVLRPARVSCRVMMSSLSESSMACCVRSSCRPSDSSSSENTASTRSQSQPERTMSADMRAPSTAPSESMRMDLPAPVSPVRMLRPDWNSTCTCSSSAKFQTVSDFNIECTSSYYALPAQSCSMSRMRLRTTGAVSLGLMTTRMLSSPATVPMISGHLQ